MNLSLKNKNSKFMECIYKYLLGKKGDQIYKSLINAKKKGLIKIGISIYTIKELKNFIKI